MFKERALGALDLDCASFLRKQRQLRLFLVRQLVLLVVKTWIDNIVLMTTKREIAVRKIEP